MLLIFTFFGFFGMKYYLFWFKLVTWSKMKSLRISEVQSAVIPSNDTSYVLFIFIIYLHYCMYWC